MPLPSRESFSGLITLFSVHTSYAGQYTCTARLNIPEAEVDVSGTNTTSIVVQSMKIQYEHYRILPKISPLPSLTSKFLHRYFYPVYRPRPYAAKSAPSAKMNAWRSTRTRGGWTCVMTRHMHVTKISIPA